MAKKTVTKAKDDNIYIKKNDIDAIRRRPTMYIGKVGDAGVFHLCKEIIDNNRDECYKKESPGDSIQIEITDEYIKTADNGRGIPTNLLRVVHETNQAGSNMTRSGGMTAGENGTGTTTYTAMSSFLEVITLRPQEKKKLTIRYKEGELVDEVLEDYDGNDHGLMTFFKPSKKVLGVNKIPINMLKDWLSSFDYTLPQSINMAYSINGVEYHVKHKSLNEFLDDHISPDARMCNTLEFCSDCEITEMVLDKKYDRKCFVEVAITYSNPEVYKGDDIYQSWMNHIQTPEHGCHLNGVLKGFSKFITEKVIIKNKKLDGVNIKKDIMNHLSIVVKAECDFANMFESQSKHKVSAIPIERALEKAVYEKLKSSNDSIIDEMVDVVLGNYRARIEGEKLRNVSNAAKAIKTWQKPDSYYPFSSAKSDKPKEIFLVEGDSAGGALKGARDARYQAILAFRGKVLNVCDVDLDVALKSIPLLNLVKVLGCGIGPSFDIKKLVFDKIIIATDADIDGYHIRTTLCCFFMKYMPEIIYHGKLYISEPPLYQLEKDKDIMYVSSQTEYLKACVDSIDNVKISFNGNEMNVKEFVTDTFDYLTTLSTCSINRSVDRYLLEYIANGFTKYGTTDKFIENIDEWLKTLTNVYSEIGFDHNTHQIYATINLIDQLVAIEDELMNELQYVIDVQKKYGLLIEYSTKKQPSISTTISRFFEFIEKLYPIVKDRFKGLGEGSTKVSKETIMDPRTRRISRVTIEDINRTINTMKVLVSKADKECMQGRKEMMMNFKFTKDMIDN